MADMLVGNAEVESIYTQLIDYPDFEIISTALDIYRLSKDRVLAFAPFEAFSNNVRQRMLSLSDEEINSLIKKLSLFDQARTIPTVQMLNRAYELVDLDRLLSDSNFRTWIRAVFNQWSTCIISGTADYTSMYNSAREAGIEISKPEFISLIIGINNKNLNLA